MKMIASSLGLVLWPALSLAAAVDATWDAVTQDTNGNAENVAYYVLYYGTSSRPAGVTNPSDGRFAYDRQVSVGLSTSARREDLVGGRRYYFSVAAVDVGGNFSDYSAEFPVDIPAETDGGGQDDGGSQADAGDGGGGGGDGGGKIEGGCGCSGAGGTSLGFACLFLWALRRRLGNQR